MRLIDADELLHRLRKRDVHTLGFITSVVENLVVIDKSIEDKSGKTELYLFTKRELQELINDVTDDAVYGYTDNIPSDFHVANECKYEVNE